MDARISLIYGLTGQVVEFYPPEYSEGVPTGTTQYRVLRASQSYDEAGEIPLSNATSDSVDATLAAAAGYSQTNRRAMTLSSGTGVVVGRRYVSGNVSGQRELVAVSAANSTAITLRGDLAYDYPITTSTFKGLRQSFVIDSTFIQDESKISYPYARSGGSEDPDLQGTSWGGYRVEWRYTLNSIARRHWTEFDVVRQAKQSGVTIHDLLERYPFLRAEAWSEQQGLDFAPQIDAAFDRLTFDCRMHHVTIDQLRDASLLDEIHRSASLWMINEAIAQRSPEMRESARSSRADYREDFMQAVGVLKIPVDQGKEGAVTQAPVRQPTFRR